VRCLAASWAFSAFTVAHSWNDSLLISMAAGAAAAGVFQWVTKVFF